MSVTSSELKLKEHLSNWESVYKRGLLTFWVLLLLDEKSSFPYEMNQEIESISKGTMSADGNSIYRALRRLEGMGLVTSAMEESNSGPDRRYYQITHDGKELLKTFISRNLMIFHEQSVFDRMCTVLQN